MKRKSEWSVEQSVGICEKFPARHVCLQAPPALVLYLMGVGWGKGRRDHFLPTLGEGVRKPLSPGDSPYFSPRIIMSRCFLLAWCFSLSSESQRNFHAHLYCQNRNLPLKDSQSPQPNWKSIGFRPYNYNSAWQNKKVNLFVFTGCGTAFDFHKTMDYMFLVGKLIPFSYRPVLVLLTVVSNF